MAKRKNSNRKKKSTKVVVAPRKRAPRIRRKTAIPRSLIEKVCSNYDPFCQVARGAKIFDENTAPSLTFSSRQVLALTTDAAGEALFWFNSAPDLMYMNATISAGLVTSWTSSSSTFSTLVGTAISRWRVVSTGIRYNTTQSWTNASGYINITETNETALASQTGQAANSLRLGPIVHTLPLRDAKLTCIGRSQGMTARTYKEKTDTNSGFSGFLLYANGTASTTVGYIEIVTNYEWQADAYTSYQNYATPAAPKVPLILDAVTSLSSVTNNIQMVSDGIGQARGFVEQAKEAIHTVSGIVDDVAAIGGTLSPAMRGIGMGSGLIHALTA